MRRRAVVLSPEAVADLEHIYDWIADAAGENVALRYLERVEAFCARFDLASERGHRRDDIRSGLRIIGFEKRVTIAFSVDDAQVTILRFFTRGQNWESVLP